MGTANRRDNGSPRTSNVLRIASLLLLALGVADLAGAEEPLYVVREGERVVFTNTPPRRAALSRPLRAEPSQPSRAAASVPSRWDPYIAIAAAEAGLEASLVKAVAQVESGLDPRAVSPKGARGLMQLMPQTASDYGVSDPFDPLQNLRAGAGHLRNLLDDFDGDLTLALAAYNAGASAVRRHGGVPDFRETRDYVRRVLARLGRGPLPPAVARGRDAGRPAGDPIQVVRGADGTLLLRN